MHDWGVVDESQGGVRAWIEMDVPRREVGGPLLKEKFIGECAFDRYAAMESASHEVIEYLCRESGVVVKDINYDKVEHLEWRLSAQKYFSDVFSERLGRMEKEDEAMRSGYGNLIAGMKNICWKFKDVMPIEAVGREGQFLSWRM